MTTIESKEVIIKKSTQEVMTYLSDLNNYGDLMPDRIKSWEVEGNEAQAYIEGLGKYAIGIQEKTYNKVVLAPTSNVPVNFTIEISVNEHAQGSAVKGAILAQLNMMMKMVAQKPLQELIDVQINRLEEVLNA
jgi:carbon monoxide dehydrogenase subunit G